MKYHETVHNFSVILTAIGGLALVGSWLAGSGEILGFSAEFLLDNAEALLLLAIAAGIGAVYHQFDKKR